MVWTTEGTAMMGRGLILLCLSMALCSCGLVYDDGSFFIENDYFQDRLGEATPDMVSKRYGPPRRIVTGPDGSEMWMFIHRYPENMIGPRREACRTHMLTFKNGVLRASQQMDGCDEALFQ